jgi:hypothetical protein
MVHHGRRIPSLKHSNVFFFFFSLRLEDNVSILRMRGWRRQLDEFRQQRHNSTNVALISHKGDFKIYLRANE